MLSQLLSLLSQSKLPNKLAMKSSESLPSSVLLQAPLHGSSSNQNLMKQATNQIKQHEGLVLHAYDDHLGYATIGYGRLIDKRKGGGITEQEAQYLLNNDIAKVYDSLNQALPFFKSLSEPRQGVLINMAFQLGVAGLLKFKRTLSLIESGDYQGASENMLKSLWAQQTPNRANEMAQQMRDNVWISG